MAQQQARVADDRAPARDLVRLESLDSGQGPLVAGEIVRRGRRVREAAGLLCIRDLRADESERRKCCRDERANHRYSQPQGDLFLSVNYSLHEPPFDASKRTVRIVDGAMYL